MVDMPDRHGQTLSQVHRQMADIIHDLGLIDQPASLQRKALFEAGFNLAEVESGHASAVRMARTLAGEPKALGTARAI